MRLTDLDANQTAVIREIEGGSKVKMRLETMGIRPGVEITKISSHFWKGPVTIKIGRAKVAIGHGMAREVILVK